MKTQRQNSNFKNTFAGIFMMAVAFLTGGNVHAQTQKMGAGLTGSASLQQDSYNAISSFSPVYNQGKTYIRWLASNDEKDGIFIVERSADGVDFQALGFKDRVGSPLCVNLFYSFIDEEPIGGVNYYRLMSVGTDQTYTYSDVVRVRTDVVNTSNPSNSALIETEK
jgi:hypothetical protein